MKKTRFHKLFRYHVRRLAYNIKLLRVLKSISREKYDEKVSASLLYGFLSAIAVNFFFQPGHVYSSGATGLAQILSVLSQRFIGFTIPVSLTFYAINIPLMIVAWYQIGHKFTIFTFITVSTGVGGGLILNHRLLTEPNGIAGHIGHTLADPNGPVCGCGRRGCVEAIASGRAIEAVSSQWDDPCDPKEVFARFRQNNEKATALVTRSAQAIANLIADLKIGLDMQKVVVGGSVGLAEGYLPLVQSLLSELPAVYHCELESAKFGQDAGLIGAAYWVKDCLLQAKNTGVVYG